MDWWEFWDIIALANRDRDEFERRVADMSEAELVDFHWTYEETAANLKDEEFFEHMDPPPTEDVLDDVAQWVVGQGLKAYEEVMKDPTKMPEDVPPEADSAPSWPGLVGREYRRRYDQPVRFREDPPPEGA